MFPFISTKGLIRLDAPTANRRRRYLINIITQRIRCECSHRLTCIPKPARRFFTVKLSPTRPVSIDTYTYSVYLRMLCEASCLFGVIGVQLVVMVMLVVRHVKSHACRGRRGRCARERCATGGAERVRHPARLPARVDGRWRHGKTGVAPFRLPRRAMALAE